MCAGFLRFWLGFGCKVEFLEQMRAMKLNFYSLTLLPCADFSLNF